MPTPTAMFVAMVAILSILQDYYPERLKKLMFVHVPHIFITVWKIIYPFIDKNTRNKITFVENNKQMEALEEEVELGQLPEIYQGKLQFGSNSRSLDREY